ncbi:Vascular endothelial growth factor receptor 3 [Dissostichus eleginoides]|uniref:Vascular endothelial growth factor receptor 3 n=1 Tax=Dissostichus eleginoides TaxID=100907 RepID=A0AAD9F019_DISEL|nr:Vascular endothelial growth factor receptor 3 [Dissostichus eleginoides]
MRLYAMVEDCGCPHSVESRVKWSRERNGNKVDIFTIDGEREIRHNDPGRRYGSSIDKSLHILRFTLSDSGRYLCNDEAVELTMIPPGTIRVDATERTSVTLDCPHDDGGSHDPTWSRDSVEIHRQKGFDVSPVDRTLTLTDVKLRDSGLYYCGRKAVFLKVIEDQGSTHPNHTDINTRTFKNTKTTIRSSNTSIFNIPSNYYD